MSKHKSVEEFYVRTVEIGGLVAALSALRLPFGKEVRSSVNFHMMNIDTDYVHRGLQYSSVVVPDKRDIDLVARLVKNGDEHAKVLRGVVVWCEINAPRYFNVEIDTYRIGAERLSSESTMHIQGQGLSEDELVDMKEHLEEGTMQRRVWMFSYQTLRRIYFQRRNHRLPQWKKFCKWIEFLPYANEMIIYGRDSNPDK